MRIDLDQVARRVSFQSLRTLWAEVGYTPHGLVTEADFEAFRQRLPLMDKGQGRQALDL